MDTTPPISATTIRGRVGDRSYTRGEQYFRDGAIVGPRIAGTIIKARCRGSRDQPYQVWVRFDTNGIADAQCSCPVGEDGYCKHTAALLLAWLHHSEEFVQAEDIHAALGRRSHAELVALVKQMLLQEPDLESLLDVPLPTGEPLTGPLTPEVYRRQVAAAFESASYEWYTGADVADAIDGVAAMARGFADQGDLRNAAIVYLAVVQEILEWYQTVEDDNGDLSGFVSDCIDALGHCLEEERDPDFRQHILRTMFDAYALDINEIGGIDFGANGIEIILEQATPEERKMVAGWVRQAMPPKGAFSENWARQAFGGFLLDLQEDELDDEAFLRICRETGRTGDLVEHLLSLGRVDEAVEATEKAGDYELLFLADTFINHGQTPLAVDLIRQRARVSKDSRLPEWLKNHYKASGNTAGALDLALDLFRQKRFGGISGYAELRELAQPLGRWEAMRPELLAALREEGQEVVIIRILLQEGDVETAVEEYRAYRESKPHLFSGYGGSTFPLEVATAAEAAAPRDALEIYAREAEGRIAARNRQNYHEAARLLQKVQEIYDNLDEPEVWEEYIANLRDRHRTLRALQQELEIAGL